MCRLFLDFILCDQGQLLLAYKLYSRFLKLHLVLVSLPFRPRVFDLRQVTFIRMKSALKAFQFNSELVFTCRMIHLLVKHWIVGFQLLKVVGMRRESVTVY